MALGANKFFWDIKAMLLILSHLMTTTPNISPPVTQTNFRLITIFLSPIVEKTANTLFI